MTTTLFSIITVSRNSSATIKQTLDSVLNQTLVAHEYIVIDGASTDGTVEIIKSYESRFRDKGIPFQWVSETDKGIYQAMNKGVSRAQGEIIGIINSDDWYEADTLASVAAHYSSHSRPAIVYGMLKSFYRGHPYAIGAIFHRFLTLTTIFHASTFVTKRVYDTIGLFAECYRIAADYDFFLRAQERGFTFSFCPVVLANCSDGGASRKGTQDQKEKASVQLSHGLISHNEYRFRIALAFLKSMISTLREKPRYN